MLLYPLYLILDRAQDLLTPLPDPLWKTNCFLWKGHLIVAPLPATVTPSQSIRVMSRCFVLSHTCMCLMSRPLART